MNDDHDHSWGEHTHDCSECGGSGRVHWNDSPIGDPACTDDAECHRCDGTGEEGGTRDRSAA